MSSENRYSLELEDTEVDRGKEEGEEEEEEEEEEGSCSWSVTTNGLFFSSKTDM
jgi:hypothetical protein